MPPETEMSPDELTAGMERVFSELLSSHVEPSMVWDQEQGIKGILPGLLQPLSDKGELDS